MVRKERRHGREVRQLEGAQDVADRGRKRGHGCGRVGMEMSTDWHPTMHWRTMHITTTTMTTTVTFRITMGRCHRRARSPTDRLYDPVVVSLPSNISTFSHTDLIQQCETHLLNVLYGWARTWHDTPNSITISSINVCRWTPKKEDIKTSTTRAVVVDMVVGAWRGGRRREYGEEGRGSAVFDRFP